MLSRFCACEVLQPLPVRTPFLVLRHARELSKSTSSVRWARLLLPACEVRDYRSRADAGALFFPSPGDWLLYPDPGGRPAPGDVARRVVVLDGTWRQTRRMLRALPGLAALPRLVVPPRPEGLRLRAAPRADALSTLEAVAGAVRQLESEALGDALLQIHDVLVDRVLRARGWRSLERAA